LIIIREDEINDLYTSILTNNLFEFGCYDRPSPKCLREWPIISQYNEEV